MRARVAARNQWPRANPTSATRAACGTLDALGRRGVDDRSSRLTLGVMATTKIIERGDMTPSWEALSVKAAGWANVDPRVIYSDHADQRAWEPGCYAWELEHDEFALGLRGLALFARLMAIVTREV